MNPLAAFGLAILAMSTAYPWAPDLAGTYCGKPSAIQCCKHRVDDCSHPIRGSRCYCDEFCVRNSTKHDDCCPDYEEVCLHLRPQPEEVPPENIELPPPGVCSPGETRMDNCNVCTCKNVNGYSLDWECTRDPCIISADVLDAVRQQRRGWTASNYTQFWGRKLNEGLKYKLGTLPLGETTLRMRADPSYYAETLRLPAAFDSRAQWPGFISRVRDQGWCGADWAVSTADVASDRFAIHSNGAEAVQLSAQHLLCTQLHCAGGKVDSAWLYVWRRGLIDETCLPYTGERIRQCPSSGKTLKSAGCGEQTAWGRKDRYQTSPVKRLGAVEDIMYEIMNSGPVQAVMKVCQDFFVYREGIYRHVPTPHSSEELCGLHAVRILGWGEDGGDKYWLAANSWGEEWGEWGHFRIALGENESDVESFVLATLANVFRANEKLSN